MKIFWPALLLAGLLPAEDPQEARVPFLGKELVYLYSAVAGTEPAPVVVALGGKWAEWRAETSPRGWVLAMPDAQLPGAGEDVVSKALEALLTDLATRQPADLNRVYLAGGPREASLVFYVRGRVPHLWAAAAALGGSPKAAIDSNRLFAANAGLAPMLWAAGEEDDGSRERLRLARYPVVARPAAEVSLAQAFEFLASHKRDPEPASIDCETGSKAFLRCYWAEITKVDPSLRNDAVPVTRVAPGAGASLALGGFGFDPARPGPGLEIGWLPDNYQGPLKLGDRIVSVGGHPVAGARQYIRMMDEVREEKAVAVLVERGKQRLRLETRTVLPKREEKVTVRLKAEWLPESREILLITRGVAAVRLHLPASRVPAAVNWNGRAVGQADGAGCWEVNGGLARCR